MDCTKFGIFEPEWTVLYGAVTKGQCRDSPHYYDPDTNPDTFIETKGKQNLRTS